VSIVEADQIVSAVDLHLLVGEAAASMLPLPSVSAAVTQLLGIGPPPIVDVGMTSS